LTWTTNLHPVRSGSCCFICPAKHMTPMVMWVESTRRNIIYVRAICVYLLIGVQSTNSISLILVTGTKTNTKLVLG
jgi:hypothetical protein